jgi:hypothetical protein
MPLDAAKVDLVLQYALLAAGQEDDFMDRDLGPIHLIKYVYVADLAFARRNQGATYTGANWTFYKFGPWAQEINARIAPALKAIGAYEKVFQSDYEDRENWTRWNKRDDRQLEELDRQLPFEVKVNLRRCVHTYGHDTPGLLDFVYKTRPMLGAAPGERLNFALELREPVPVEPATESGVPEMTDRRRKKLRERMRALQEQSKSKATPAKPKLVKPPAPRYDEVFLAGLHWLDGMAGPAFTDQSLTVEFADEVWKSSTRHGDDLP